MSNRRPCQFFLRGSCRFGDNCRDYHPKGTFFDRSSSASAAGNNSNNNGVLGNSNSFSSEIFNPFNSKNQNNTSSKPNNPNSNPTLQTLDLIGIVVNSGVWPFGKIGLLNQTPLFTSLDLSFEEYRYKFYQNDRCNWENLHVETLVILNRLYRNFIDNGKAQGYLPNEHKLYDLDLSKYSKIGNIYLPNLGRDFASSNNSKGPFGNLNTSNNSNSTFSPAVSPFGNQFSGNSSSSTSLNPFSGGNSLKGVFGETSNNNNNNSLSGIFNPNNSSSVFGGSSNNSNALSNSVFSGPNSNNDMFGGFSNNNTNNPFCNLNPTTPFSTNSAFSNTTQIGNSIGGTNNTPTPFGNSQSNALNGNSNAAMVNNSPFSTNQSISSGNATQSLFQNTSSSPFNTNSQLTQSSPFAGPQSLNNPFLSQTNIPFSNNNSTIFGVAKNEQSNINNPFAPNNSSITNNIKYSFDNPDVNDDNIAEYKQELLPWEHNAFTSQVFDNNKIPEKIPPKSLRI